MPPRLLVISAGLYRLLLQIYPADFRQRFAAEMGQVFRCLCVSTYLQSGRVGVLRLWLPALWDGAGAALYQWRLRLFKGRTETMKLNLLVDWRDEVQPLSHLQAGLAVLPFLAFGLSSWLDKQGALHGYLIDLPAGLVLLLHPYLAFNWLVLTGLGAGILAGFPRWAYAYLGWALLFGWWWSDVSFLGRILEWKIWLPLAGVMLVPLLVRRSLAPLRALFAGLGREWTLIALGVYIFYGYFALLADENHHPYFLLFLILTALGVSAGAWGYFRLASPLRRLLALAGGLLVMIVLGVISDATWDYRAYYGLPDSAQYTSWIGVSLYLGLFLLTAGGGLFVHWRRLRRDAAKGN